MVILLVTVVEFALGHTYIHNLLFISVIDRWCCHGITAMCLGLSNKLLVVCPVQFASASSRRLSLCIHLSMRDVVTEV